jgi:serine/threonine protein kinase
LLVERPVGAPPTEVVYKVSLGGDADRRLADEYRILSGLDHPAVVRCYGVIELAGRRVLVEALAGRLSLSDELRRNGTPGIEFLHRWGYDLLDALRYLEREGRSHRDIKPENLGITEIGTNREQHLVLFDFSLAAIPATDVRAGTPPYLEPFLADRTPPRWDLAAERYAAAVTLYEMATGETPPKRSYSTLCCSTLQPGTHLKSSSTKLCAANRPIGSATPRKCFSRGSASSKGSNRTQ